MPTLTVPATTRGAEGQPAPTRSAVFIDKDGTLLADVPHNTNPALLRFQPGALESLAALAAAGLALVVISNQSGLSLGYFTRWEFSQLQAALERQLQEAGGIALTDFVVCPHMPTPEGQPACLCRTPAPGMLIRAARAHRIDLTTSWMVGDTLNDIEAGRRAGCRTLLLNTGGETEWRRSPLRTPHARCSRWDAVTPLILADHSGLKPAVDIARAAAG